MIILHFKLDDCHKGRQKPLEACCGSFRICDIDLDERLELSPLSLSIATSNGSLRKPLAKFDFG